MLTANFRLKRKEIFLWHNDCIYNNGSTKRGNKTQKRVSSPYTYFSWVKILFRNDNGHVLKQFKPAHL
ncbi:hypothetical protein PEDI_09740 [Persicobacter diffluens]|uniref:Uncharacterized protein n=1 Tax=Persicobacter diffluens TaxID=981 RepID=A0AAN4VWX3_9BACT|nr:hypothetical protein PEDI_09740 [Persicobacter diffluens]